VNDEMNGKIARDIMGWVLDDNGYWHDGEMRVFVAPDTRAANLDSAEFDAWNPSGNWAHFGLVLGRMWEKFGKVDVTVEKYASGEGVVAFCLDGEANGEEPLEAACRAILEAWDANS